MLSRARVLGEGKAMQRFYLPTEIITGCGCLAELGRVSARYGRRVMLVCGLS